MRRMILSPWLIVPTDLPPAVLFSIHGRSRPGCRLSSATWPSVGIKSFNCTMSLDRLRLCWFSNTNLAAACSKVLDGLTPKISACRLSSITLASVSSASSIRRGASALANSPTEDDFVDVPDAGPQEEAGHVFASHVVTPFGEGRPLRLL